MVGIGLFHEAEAGMFAKTVIHVVRDGEEYLVCRSGKIKRIAVVLQFLADCVSRPDTCPAAAEIQQFSVFVCIKECIELNGGDPSLGKQSTVLLDVCHKMRDRIVSRDDYCFADHGAAFRSADVEDIA